MINRFLKGIFKSPIGFGLVILAVVAGYFYFLSSVKIARYQIFNLKKTITWAQAGTNLYRTHSHNNVDNFLLSEDPWREYTFSMQVVNPQECGFLYDYLDAQNYYFIYFKKKTNDIIIGHFKNGKVDDLKALAFNLPLSLTVEIKKQNGFFQLTVNDRKVIEYPTGTTAGKIGLMINTLESPPTIFNHIMIRGLWRSGQPMNAEVSIKPENGLGQAFKYFVPFYLAFAFLLVVFPFLAVRRPQISLRFKSMYPFLLHVFLAVCFFWPFVSRGEVAVFSYDNLGEIFPLFYYSQQNFLNILHGHAPWLWNPLIHNGFPFYSNHWDMIYYPLNWLVFLSPPSSLLTAVTFKSFFEVAATGILAYGFFAIELQNKRWALFSSVTYQMCSLLIFTMGIFPATSTYFAMTFYLYVLWSAVGRKPLASFLLLVFAVVLILTSANVAFIFYACLSLAVISLYRFVSLGKDGNKIFSLTAAAWIVGTLISSVRIFSSLAGVTESNRMAETFHTIHDRAYMAVRLFLPELGGWMGPDAFNVFASQNLGLIFRELELPASNSQNGFFVYFGVIPALLLTVSFLAPVKGRHAFWKIYSLVVLGIALFWQPIWGILNILCMPLNHYSYYMVILPVGICALIGYTAMAWEAGHFDNKDFFRNLWVAGFLIAAYLFVFMTYLFPSLAYFTRIIFIALGLGIAVYYFLRDRGVLQRERFLMVVNQALYVLILAILIFTTLILTLAPIPKKEALGTEMILPFLWLCAAGVMILNFGLKKSLTALLAPVLMAFFLSACFIFSPAGDIVFGWEPPVRIYAIDVLIGFVRFFLLMQIGLLGFAAIRKKTLSAGTIFVVLLVFTAMDLIVFNARFNNITSPFYFKNAFYPKGFAYQDLDFSIRRQMDLVNYRVNHQDRQDFNANKNLVFDVPSYTGTVGYMTKRFSKLLMAFGYVKGIYMLYPEDATDNDRFLDLSAVRYTFDPKGNLIERPTSLARLNFISSAEIVADEEALLNRLKEEAFDPRKTILISQSISPVERGQRDAIVIPIMKSSPNSVESQIMAPATGFLLFADSYDKGWKAYLNGSRVPVLRANYNFMACLVPGPGEYKIRFVYAPSNYQNYLHMSLLGICLLFLIIFIGLLAKLNKKKEIF